jgi:hypothetical protein
MKEVDSKITKDISIKYYKGEIIKRFSISPDLDFQELKEKLQGMKFLYMDEENEWINLTNESEWNEAKFICTSKKIETLKIKLVNEEFSLDILKTKAEELYNNLSNTFQNEIYPNLVKSYAEIQTKLTTTYNELINNVQKDTKTNDISIDIEILDEKDKIETDSKKKLFMFGNEQIKEKKEDEMIKKDEQKEVEQKEDEQKEDLGITKDEETDLFLLQEMGWTDRKRNIELLREHRSVVSVINFYLN